jgi:hypothetical protein
MKILIVNKSDLSIASKYDADAPSQHIYGGPWGDPNQTEHIICSPLLDADCVVIVEENGLLRAEEDQALLDAKVERQWGYLRVQRNSKLSECDWTQMSDAPLNAQDKTSWATYRQELRDLPENTVDPRSPTWPQKPDVQI